MFIGALSSSTYDFDSRFGPKLIYIPTPSISGVEHIPALLSFAPGNMGDYFCIYFHGNACDINQVSYVAKYESRRLNAHYLILEYPGTLLSLYFNT